ncbi:MAG TPA: gamma-glutamyl-gamma-aminobutyrate hydrolase family protein [Actinomycetota bacterium]|nr:gamma-glutamyl-gamma-aminobutyrate hydrolase family protein [Actinomycetota bacterium]
MRALIAVAGRALRAGRVAGWRDAAVGAPAAYVHALRRAGAQEAVLLPTELAPAEAAKRLDRFDGLLLMGGGDVDPVRYGEERGAEVGGVNTTRDEFEIALVRAAVERKVPTLAICRGMQVLNVALGGSLHQHLNDGGSVTHRHDDGTYMSHPVRLKAGSNVAAAMGAEVVTTASAHHQGLARFGRDLVAVGWAEDDLVEAVEHTDGWVVGVQWHPERTAVEDPAQQGLFDAMVEQAAR